jgi:RNA polymerase-binding transcription factor DksA
MEPREGLMAARELAMRRVILSNLFEHLRLNYDFERPADSFVSGQISDREIDIVLSYKSDHRLGELREALARVESGTYGYCIGCKRPLSRADLEEDPAKRVCVACEESFNMCHQQANAPFLAGRTR